MKTTDMSDSIPAVTMYLLYPPYNSSETLEKINQLTINFEKLGIPLVPTSYPFISDNIQFSLNKNNVLFANYLCDSGHSLGSGYVNELADLGEIISKSEGTFCNNCDTSYHYA